MVKSYEFKMYKIPYACCILQTLSFDFFTICFFKEITIETAFAKRISTFLFTLSGQLHHLDTFDSSLTVSHQSGQYKTSSHLFCLYEIQTFDLSRYMSRYLLSTTVSTPTTNLSFWKCRLWTTPPQITSSYTTCVFLLFFVGYISIK